jgi:multicomponent Na+:H+ antiporter subunit C
MTETALLYMVVGVVLFGMGLFALVAYPHLLRKILGVNVMGTGTFMVFIAIAHGGDTEPIDPIPHALVITGIVVAVCATGLALALASQVQALTGQPRIDGSEREDQT